jgi:hypothetical protein
VILFRLKCIYALLPVSLLSDSAFMLDEKGKGIYIIHKYVDIESAKIIRKACMTRKFVRFFH